MPTAGEKKIKTVSHTKLTRINTELGVCKYYSLVACRYNISCTVIEHFLIDVTNWMNSQQTVERG